MKERSPLFCSTGGASVNLCESWARARVFVAMWPQEDTQVCFIGSGGEAGRWPPTHPDGTRIHTFASGCGRSLKPGALGRSWNRVYFGCGGAV